MCLASAIGDHYSKEWKYFAPQPGQPDPLEWIRKINEGTQPELTPISRIEYEKLKQQVKDMTALLKIAIDYDKRTGQPHCEVEQKIALLRSVASAFKINLDEILES